MSKRFESEQKCADTEYSVNVKIVDKSLLFFGTDKR